jgi:hypothetical protein
MRSEAAMKKKATKKGKAFPGAAPPFKSKSGKKK